MTQTFYWHDYETFGVNPFKDRPSQFAGIRTDEDLNIIGEPLMIFCKPPKDTLPSPGASLVTGVTPQECETQGVNEAEFIRQIHQEFSQPQTCGVGYNSIRFDDEFTRNTLYRNFYDPYEREYRNGNSRWDIIDMVRLCYALRPEGIQWPVNDKGVVSFRLEELTVANGFAHENAHDALADVIATIDIARLIKQKQPNLFAHAVSLRDRRVAEKYLDVRAGRPVLHISSKYPAAQYCTGMVLPLMADPTNNRGVIVYDLSVDPTPMLSLSAEEIAARIFTKTVDLPGGVERIPLKTVHTNKSPMLASANRLDEATTARLGLDVQKIEQHRQQISQAKGLLGKLAQVFTREGFKPATDVDGQIYQGFLSDEDKRLMVDVRQATPEELRDGTWIFKDKRLGELFFRYRARNWPETLTEEEQQEWSELRYQRLSEPSEAVSWNMETYFAEIERLRAEMTLNEKQQQILSDLEQWGDMLVAE